MHYINILHNIRIYTRSSSCLHPTTSKAHDFTFLYSWVTFDGVYVPCFFFFNLFICWRTPKLPPFLNYCERQCLENSLKWRPPGRLTLLQVRYWFYGVFSTQTSMWSSTPSFVFVVLDLQAPERECFWANEWCSGITQNPSEGCSPLWGRRSYCLPGLRSPQSVTFSNLLPTK